VDAVTAGMEKGATEGYGMVLRLTAIFSSVKVWRSSAASSSMLSAIWLPSAAFFSTAATTVPVSTLITLALIR